MKKVFLTLMILLSVFIVAGCGKASKDVNESNGSQENGDTTNKVDEPIREQEEVTHKGIVYLNPKNLTVKCNESNSQIGTDEANPSGCMKFYIFDDSGDTYKMILDHNTTEMVEWNSDRTNKSMKEAKVALEKDTSEWAGNPRLITAKEVAKVTNTQAFDGKAYDNISFGKKTSEEQTISEVEEMRHKYAWLFDYTYNCKIYNCNVAGSNATGYWTSTPHAEDSERVWYVKNIGTLSSSPADYELGYGIRPVIELKKSQVSL